MSSLADLKIFVGSNNEIDTISNEFGKMTTLQKLQLSHNKIRNFLPFASLLPHLKELILSHNNLTNCEAEKIEAPCLERVDLSYNGIGEIPSWIRNGLPCCHSLSVSNNNIKDCQLIGNLSNVTNLDISHNQITVLTLNLTALVKLKRLDVSFNKLTALPNFQVPQPVQLEEIWIGNNSLEKLPTDESYWKALTHLKVLVLERNKLRALCPQLANLVALEVLDVRNNDISYIDPEISLCQNLSKLLIVGNILKTIPSHLLSAEKNLTQQLLLFLKNKLDPNIAVTQKVSTGNSIPLLKSTKAKEDFIQKLFDISSQNLRNEDWKGNEVWKICAHNQIKKLCANKNKLSIFPVDEHLFSCAALEIIELTHNLIQDISVAESDLKTEFGAIRSCNLSHNRINVSVGSNIFSLSMFINLQEIILTNNCLTFIPPSLERLPLVTVIMDVNSITEIHPKTLLSWSKSLAFLDLSSNKVNTIPARELAQCHSLTHLNLSSNDILDIPPQLGLCTQLKHLKLEANPTKSIRSAILSKPTSQILEYLRNKI